MSDTDDESEAGGAKAGWPWTWLPANSICIYFFGVYKIAPPKDSGKLLLCF